MLRFVSAKNKNRWPWDVKNHKEHIAWVSTFKMEYILFKSRDPDKAQFHFCSNTMKILWNGSVQDNAVRELASEMLDLASFQPPGSPRTQNEYLFLLSSRLEVITSRRIRARPALCEGMMQLVGLLCRHVLGTQKCVTADSTHFSDAISRTLINETFFCSYAFFQLKTRNDFIIRKREDLYRLHDPLRDKR